MRHEDWSETQKMKFVSQATHLCHPVGNRVRSMIVAEISQVKLWKTIVSIVEVKKVSNNGAVSVTHLRTLAIFH